MKNFLLIFASALITLSMIGCSSSNDPTEENNNTNKTPLYLPLSIGNEWHYEGHLDGTFRQYNIRLIDDTVINSNKYFVGVNSIFPGLLYMRSDEGGIYHYYPDSLKAKQIMVFGKTGSTLEIRRNDKGINLRDILTVVEENVKKEIMGVSYNKCIVINKKTDMQLFGDTWNTAGSFQDIYAENIGLVHSSVTSSGSSSGIIYLKSYIVK